MPTACIKSLRLKSIVNSPEIKVSPKITKEASFRYQIQMEKVRQVYEI